MVTCNFEATVKSVIEEKNGVSKKDGTSWRSITYALEHSQYDTFAGNVFGEERIGKLDLQVGQKYDFVGNLDSHEYNGKYYLNLRITDATPCAQVQDNGNVPGNMGGGSDELPFG